MEKEAIKLLKEARDMLILCTLLDKSGQTDEMKIKHESKEMILIPESDMDVFELGKLHDKFAQFGQVIVKYNSNTDGGIGNIDSMRMNEGDFVKYLID